MLNLRALGTTDDSQSGSGTQQSSRFSLPIFMITPQSLSLGNIGEALEYQQADTLHFSADYTAEEYQGQLASTPRAEVRAVCSSSRLSHLPTSDIAAEIFKKSLTEP